MNVEKTLISGLGLLYKLSNEMRGDLQVGVYDD